MSKHRIDRISEEVKREISEIIRQELKDPRIAMMCSVVAAEVTPDLRYAKVYISVLGSEEEKEATLKGLHNAAGYIRKELGNRVKLRHSPEVSFVLDKSIEHGAHIMKLLHDVKQQDGGENS